MAAVADPDRTHELRALDAAHFLHPFTDHAALAAKGVRVITRGEGIWIWDADGHRILDAMSGLWCVNAGYGRRELAEAAYHQMRTLPFDNTFFQTTTEPPVRLAWRLSELAPPVDGRRFTHVFFTSSGSEANDTNVRLARRYWDLMGQPQRKVIISRWNAYHGSTVAAASLGGMRAMHEQGDLPIPGIVHIEQPYDWQHRQPGETLRNLACAPRAGWRRRSSRSARTRWPPSSPSRCRAPAASSSRPRPTGPRSSASSSATAFC